MKYAKYSLLLLLVLAMVSGASAIPSEAIVALDCGFTAPSSEMQCGMTADYECLVYDNTGATTINSVVVTVGDTIYPASLTAGTYYNGTWTATINIVNGLPSLMDVSNVKVTNAANQVCASVPQPSTVCGPDLDTCKTSTGCYFEFNANQEFEVDCECTYETTTTCPSAFSCASEGNCDISTIVHTPSFGCGTGVEPYITYGICDSCVANWVPNELVCAINRSEGDGLSGTMTATFTDENLCCVITQNTVVSDCIAPGANAAELTCNQGYWLSEYNDVGATRKNAGEFILYDGGYNTKTKAVTNTELDGGGITRFIQPISFDFDDDGVVETLAIAMTTASSYTVRLYDPQLELEATLPNSTAAATGSYLRGDPGLFEFDARGGFTEGYKQGLHGAGFAVVDQPGLNNYFRSFRYNHTSGLFDELVHFKLDASGVDDTGTASVLCIKDRCFTTVNGEYLASIDPVTGSTNYIAFPGANAPSVVGDDNWRNLPAKVVGEDVVVAKGYTGAGKVGLYACNFTTLSCGSVFNIGADPINVSEIYIGPPQDNKFPVYWSKFANGDATYNVAFLTTSTLSFSNAYSYTDLQTGADPKCVIAPAAAECPQEGAFFASTWGPEATVIQQEITLPFGWTGEEFTSFGFLGTDSTWGDPDPYTTGGSGIPYQATSNEKVAFEVCSEDVCYQAAGITGHYIYNTYDWTVMDFYKSENGGQWFQIDDNPFLGRYQVGNNDDVGVQYDDCYISDNYLAWGAINGDLYAVRTKTLEVNGVPVNDLDNPGAGYICTNSGVNGALPTQDRWQGMYVDMFDVSTGSWVNVYNNSGVFFDNTGSWPTGGDENFASYVGKHMICDSDRCIHMFIDEAGTQGVLQIYHYNPTPDVNTFIPQGDLLGGTLNDYSDIGRYITGFAEGTNGDYEYYSFRTLGSGGTGFVARIDKTIAATPPALASPIIPWAVTVQGLRADPSFADDIYYSLIPASIGANTTANDWCYYMSNSSDPNYALKSDDGDRWESLDVGNHPLSSRYADSKELRYVICDYDIWRVSGGVPTKIYSDQVNKRGDQYMSGHYSVGVRQRDYGVITAPSLGWSIGDFDEFGEYYTTYIEGLCQGGQGYCMSQTGSYSVTCCPSYNWNPGDPDAWPNGNELTITYATFQEDKGVRFPLRNYFSDVSILGDGECVNGGSLYPCSFAEGGSSPYPSGNTADLRKLVAVTGMQLSLCQDESDLGTLGSGEPGCRPFGSWDYRDLSLSYGQRPSMDIYPESLTTWDTFKGTTSRLHVGPTSINRPVYAILGTASQIASSFTRVGCFIASATGGLIGLGSSTLNLAECSAQLLSVDADRDGTDEVVLSNGIYEYSNAQKLRSFGQPESVGIGVVDLNTDTFFDFVFVGGAIRHLLSDSDFEFTFSQTLNITSLTCSYDSVSETITARVLAATPDYDNTRFSGKLYTSDGQLLQSKSGSTVMTFVPSNNGDYEVRATATVGDQTATATCEVTVEGLTAPPPVSVTDTDYYCSMAPDGEFNYDDDPRNHGWLVLHDVVMTGTTMYMSSGEVNMRYNGVECTDSEVAVSASFTMPPVGSSGPNTNTKLIVFAEHSTGAGGAHEELPVANVWFYGKDYQDPQLGLVSCPCILAADALGQNYELVSSNLESGFDTYHTVEIQMARDRSYYELFVNGDSKGIFTNLNGDWDGAVTAVELEGGSSAQAIEFDWVRVDGLTGEGGDTRSDKERKDASDASILADCGKNVDGGFDDFRNFTEKPVGTLEYLVIDEYCTSKANADAQTNVYCGFKDLQQAVRTNPLCYQEALYYCVDITYPLSAGFDPDNEIDMIKSEKLSTAGAAACATALQSSLTTSMVTSPLWNLVWGSVTRGTGSAIGWMVFIFILVVGIALWMKARR